MLFQLQSRKQYHINFPCKTCKRNYLIKTILHCCKISLFIFQSEKAV